MFVFPAIDILGGQVVRLAQGRYDQVTVYNESPLAQAQLFAQIGATWLHVVDLDGARSGTPENLALIQEIARELPLRIEVGGGVRTRETAHALLSAGVTRVVLGTKLATDTAFVRSLIEEFGPDALVAGVDARDGRVAVQGWREEGDLDALELVHSLSDLGLRHLVFTDIARDGMRVGVDEALYESVAEAAGFPVIISGGIATLNDLGHARVLGDEIIEGVIIGRALYEKAFTLNGALALIEGEVTC